MRLHFTNIVYVSNNAYFYHYHYQHLHDADLSQNVSNAHNIHGPKKADETNESFSNLAKDVRVIDWSWKSMARLFHGLEAVAANA